MTRRKLSGALAVIAYGGEPAAPSPKLGDATEAEIVLEAAPDRVAWRFENQLVAVVDIAMLIAIPALFFMAMLALMVPL